MEDRDNKGRFAPGNKGKPKGAGNKSIKQLRGLVQEFLSNNMEGLQAAYDQMEPKDQLTFVDKMLKHVLPPLQAREEKSVEPPVIQNGKELPD